MKSRIDKIRGIIEGSAKIAGTNPKDILIVAATKTVAPSIIQQAVDCGIAILGENRVQEAQKKVGKVEGNCNWHLIGHLQRNKVRQALRFFSMFQSLDSYRLAVAIENAAQNCKINLDVLVQVNIGLEESKYGVTPKDVVEFIMKVSKLQHLRIKGLMAIPPFKTDPEHVRPFFVEMRKIFEDIQNRDIDNVDMRYLSMGMTNDYHVAIEEGANVVRIGTGIFGERVC